MQSSAGSGTGANRRPCYHPRPAYKPHITDVVLRCPICNGIIGYERHPAYIHKEPFRCSFRRLSPEVRLMIYRFLWGESATDNGTQRRIHWEGASPFRPQYQSLTSVRPRKFLDTAILSTCKFIYREAHPELISKSTVVVEIRDTKVLQRYANILNSMRYLEIRDSDNSRGRQLFLTRENEGRWLPEEKEDEFRELTYWLRGIKPVVEQAPQLREVIIGFEVLRVLADCRAGIFEGQDLLALRRQVHYNFLPTGLGTLKCKDVGKWRVVRNRGPDIEVRHFNVVANFKQCESMICVCFGSMPLPRVPSIVNREALWKYICSECRQGGEMALANLAFIRHRMAQYGLLGEQAQRDCRATAAQIEKGRELTGWTRKTWKMIELDATDDAWT